MGNFMWDSFINPTPSLCLNISFSLVKFMVEHWQFWIMSFSTERGGGCSWFCSRTTPGLPTCLQMLLVISHRQHLGIAGRIKPCESLFTGWPWGLMRDVVSFEHVLSWPWSHILQIEKISTLDQTKPWLNCVYCNLFRWFLHSGCPDGLYWGSGLAVAWSNWGVLDDLSTLDVLTVYGLYSGSFSREGCVW